MNPDQHVSTTLAAVKNGTQGNFKMTKLCWFRTDLRLADQPALTAAMADGDAISLFIISSEQWAEHSDSVHKVDFWLRALQSLSVSLAKLNVPLKILNVPLWSQVPQALLNFAKNTTLQRSIATESSA